MIPPEDSISEVAKNFESESLEGIEKAVVSAAAQKIETMVGVYYYEKK